MINDYYFAEIVAYRRLFVDAMPDVAIYYHGIILKKEHNLSTTTKNCHGKPFLGVDFIDAITIVNRKWKSGWICTQIISADKKKNLKVIDKLDVIYSEIFFKWKFLNFYRQLNMSDLKWFVQSFFFEVGCIPTPEFNIARV